MATRTAMAMLGCPTLPMSRRLVRKSSRSIFLPRCRLWPPLESDQIDCASPNCCPCTSQWWPQWENRTRGWRVVSIRCLFGCAIPSHAHSAAVLPVDDTASLSTAFFGFVYAQFDLRRSKCVNECVRCYSISDTLVFFSNTCSIVCIFFQTVFFSSSAIYLLAIPSVDGVICLGDSVPISTPTLISR